MTEKELLAAFEKAIAEYETDTWEVEFSQVLDSYDMFIAHGNRRMDEKPINYLQFVRKMLKYLP